MKARHRFRRINAPIENGNSRWRGAAKQWIPWWLMSSMVRVMNANCAGAARLSISFRGHVACNERPSPTLLSTIKGQTCSKWPPRRPPEMYRRLAAFRRAGHGSSHIPSVLPSFHLAPDNLPRLKPKKTILFRISALPFASRLRFHADRELYARNYTASRILNLLMNPATCLTVIGI